MDTKQVAQVLGTTPKVLRRFLRDKSSTYQAVGSSERYSFRETDIPELTRRFKAWADTKAPVKTPEKPADGINTPDATRTSGDEAVWAEEEARTGKPIVLPDIRDPQVRNQVREAAKAAERRLNELLMAKGLHVSQGFVSSVNS